MVAGAAAAAEPAAGAVLGAGGARRPVQRAAFPTAAVASLVARTAFYPSLAYNLVRYKLQGEVKQAAACLFGGEHFASLFRLHRKKERLKTRASFSLAVAAHLSLSGR